MMIIIKIIICIKYNKGTRNCYEMLKEGNGVELPFNLFTLLVQCFVWLVGDSCELRTGHARNTERYLAIVDSPEKP